MQIQLSGSTSVIFGVFRAQAGRIAEENRFRSPVTGSVRLSVTRGRVMLYAYGRRVPGQPVAPERLPDGE